ncbi:hypothetical protein DSO57_1034643 [Entomophthora muscae]|uniref:Uncharacterized protein n=1 Tax=Entomophthora muscae TaxID=34485 RepID=A0ACC2TM69_9FUNG|nr:hypothetical protein DSO57_1034643 [Entomophthora muscae]
MSLSIPLQLESFLLQDRARLINMVYWSTGSNDENVSRFKLFDYKKDILTADGKKLFIHDVSYWLPEKTIAPDLPSCRYHRCTLDSQVQVNITTSFSTTSLENDLLALQSPASYFSKAVDTHHLHIEARELTLKTLWYKQIYISINYTLLKENDPVINVKAPLVANGHAQLLYGANE